MPRTVNSTLKSWLDNNPLLESHSTLEIFLPFSEDGGSYYYSTSGEVSISGNLYLKRLKEVGELKLSLGSAADRIEVRLDNSDDTEGWLFQQSSDILIQNHVKVGRIYYNPQVPGSQYHQILFQGTIVSYQVLDTEIQLSIVSDLYAGGQIGGTRLVSKTCQFKFKDATTCAFVGAGSVCSKLLNDAAGGCLFYANQHHFGGFVFIDSQSVQQTSVGSPPAKNQLVKIGTTAFKQRAVLNFVSGATVVDDPATNSTKVTVTGTGSARVYAIHAKTDFLAIGDGVANDTAALQAAIDSAASTGRALYIPGGTYLVTGLTITGHVNIFGDGDDESVIYSTTNAPILNCVGASFFVAVIENLVIRGSKTAGTSQIGIKLDSAGDTLGGRVEKVKIQTTGGSGLYVGLVFSSVFRDIFFEDIEGWPVEINAPFQPCLYFENVYPGVVSASHPAGFYVRQCQNALFNNCNGLNSVPLNSVWMILGRKSGLYGETTNGSANVQLLNCNIESYHSYGIRALRGSQVDLIGHNTFARHNVNTTLSAGVNSSVTSIPLTGNLDTLLFPASGELLVIEGANQERMTMTSRTTTTATVTRGTPAFSFTTAAIAYSCHAIGIEYDVDTVGAFPNLANKSMFDDATVIQDGPEYFYKNSAFVHGNDLPPVMLNGEGPRVTQARPLHSYYNTTRSRAEELKRADGTFPAVKITATTSFANPGARYIECNFSATGTVTLPAPSWYDSGEIVIVKDISGNAATNPITVSGGGGSTVGGSSHTINTNNGGVVLMPEKDSNDWRILATYPSISGSGTADNLMVWDTLNKAKQITGLAYDGGVSALKSPARVYVGTIGSVSFPSIARTGDEDTGIYWPLANVLAFSVGGSDRARLDNAFNVLPYGAGAGQTGSISLWNLANTLAVTIRAHDTTASYTLTLPSAVAAGYFKTDGSGNVSFDSAVVNGSGTAANLMVWGSGNAASEVSGLLWDAGNSALKSPGRVYVGTTGSVGFPAVALATDADTGFYFPVADTIGVAAGGGDKIQFNVNGMSLLGNKLFLDASNTAFITSGNGSPETVITAPRGSFYLRLDGGAGTTVYSKESGTGNTGWVPLGGGISGLTAGRVALSASANTLSDDPELIYDGFNLTSGRVYHSGGTGSAPGVGPSADTGTGWYQSVTGKYSFASSTGGLGERVRLWGSGISVLGNRIYWDASETAFDLSGTGSPEGVITAARGSVYRRLDGGVGTTLYSKETGAGNTGWVAIAAGSGAATSLNNLASVAINTTLVSDTNNTDDLGTSGINWRDLYLAGTFALAARTDPGSPTDSDVWRSSARNALSIRVSGQTEDAVTSMWRNSAVFSWDTSTAETSMFSDTGVGTKTVAANRLKVGNQVRLKLAGTFGTDVVTPGNFTIKLKNGATTMATISAFGLPAAASDQNWWIEAVGTVATTGASGSIFWTISFYYNDITNTLKTRAYTVNSSTIDTTASKLMDITGQFSASDIDNFWEVVTASIEMVS